MKVRHSLLQSINIKAQVSNNGTNQHQGVVIMKRKSMAPRNPFVAAARFRKAGEHRKSKKALRRAARMAMQQGALAEWQGSRLLTCTT